MSNHNSSESLSVIIPTRKASGVIERLLTTILSQTLVPDEIIIVDSESDDQTVEIARRFDKTRIISIKQSDFDHGGTRDMAFRVSTGNVVIFLTQDALPVNAECFEKLVQALDADRVAAAYARQIAYPDAPFDEKYTRLFNYPETGAVHERADVGRIGIKAYYLSDTCAAYRRDVYLEMGGFDRPIITNEDMAMAARLVKAGYRIAYCAQAPVYHSHDYTLKQVYRRYFDIGVFMRIYQERFTDARISGEGTRYALSVIKAMISQGHVLTVFPFCGMCIAKFLGHRAGLKYERYSKPEILRRTGNSLSYVIALILGFTILSEPVSALDIIGIVAIIAGVILIGGDTSIRKEECCEATSATGYVTGYVAGGDKK